MKIWQSASVITVATLLGVFALCSPLALRAGPRLTEAQAAALQPIPPGQIPRSGNFWSLSCPTNPPLPLDLYPNLPVYRLPDFSFLVDDTSLSFAPPGQAISAPAAARSFLTQGALSSPPSSAPPMLNEAAFPGTPLPITNAPPPNNPNPPQLISPGSIPTNGTFWFLAETNWPPLPFDPCPGCNVYALSDGTYMVDDTAYSWPTSSGGATPQGGGQPAYVTGDLWLEITGVTNSQARLILHGTSSGVLYTIMSRQSLSPSDPWDAEQPLTGADGQDWTPVQIPTFGRPVLFFQALVGSAPPQRLWLCAVGVSNNCFNCVLHGTSENTSYDIRSTPVLSGGTNTWAVETNFPGASGQFWTPVSIPLSGRPSLFLSARSWVDSTGSGIPDWWLLQYCGTTSVNPNALDAAGDGWTLYQKFQMGLNPNVFYTPPAPQGLTVNYNANSGTALISWLPAPGPVTGYTLTDSAGQSFNLPASATSFANYVTGVPNGYGDPTIYETYQLQAHYAGGNSALASHALLQGVLMASVVYGPQNSAYLEVSALPAGTKTIQLSEFDESAYGRPGLPVVVTNIDIAVTTNGLYPLPAVVTPPDDVGNDLYGWWGQALGPNGALSVATLLGWSGYSCSFTFTSSTVVPAVLAPPYFDGRAQLKQNLIFLLRAGLVDIPFQYTATDCSSNQLNGVFVGWGLP